MSDDAAREALESFRRILTAPDSVTSQLNAVRTYHDFLKVLLRGLCRPEEERFIAQSDIKRRFMYLTIKYPQLSQFGRLVDAVKAARDKVEHSDRETPRVSELENWEKQAEALIEVARISLREQEHKEAKLRGQKLLAKFVLIGEFEEVERISERLSARGLAQVDIEKAIEMFRSFYGEPYKWNDAKLDEVGDAELADAIAGTARMNGLFNATLDVIVEPFFSLHSPDKESVQ